MILDISIAQNSMCYCSIFHCEKSLLPITFYLLRKKFTNGKRNCLKHYADNEHVCVDVWKLVCGFLRWTSQKGHFSFKFQALFFYKEAVSVIAYLLWTSNDKRQKVKSAKRKLSLPKCNISWQQGTDRGVILLSTNHTEIVQNNNLKFVPLKNTHFITTSNLKRTLE